MKLINEIKDFQELLFGYFENNKHEIFKVKIEEQLSSRSAFTAFKRWIVRSDLKYDHLKQYIID